MKCTITLGQITGNIGRSMEEFERMSLVAMEKVIVICNTVLESLQCRLSFAIVRQPLYTVPSLPYLHDKSHRVDKTEEFS